MCLQRNNVTELEQRVEILEVEVASLTDDVEDVEIDVNQVDDRMTVIEGTVIGNTNNIAGNIDLCLISKEAHL